MNIIKALFSENAPEIKPKLLPQKFSWQLEVFYIERFVANNAAIQFLMKFLQYLLRFYTTHGHFRGKHTFMDRYYAFALNMILHILGFMRSLVYGIVRMTFITTKQRKCIHMYVCIYIRFTSIIKMPGSCYCLHQELISSLTFRLCHSINLKLLCGCVTRLRESYYGLNCVDP